MAERTPKSYFEEKIARKLVERPETSKAVNSIYEFNITGENGGVWTGDLTKEPGSVQAGSTGNAKCIVTCAADGFMNIRSGKIDPQMAVISGKLEDKGDNGVALKMEEG